jgi:hypothetical protein
VIILWSLTMGMKFIRGLIYPNANAGGRGVAWRLKWIYEFWGFCVNGTSSTTVPGGFATPNGVVAPADFTGGTSLMASGTDGSHPAVSGNLFSGDCVFTSASANFTVAMAGKALVIWKPNSDSSEDSIYVITRVISSTQLMININTGGTPNASTKHPSMTARTSVNYRVVDMEAGSNSLTSPASAQGTFLVLNLDAASVNPGQGNAQGQSQIQLVHTSRGSLNDTWQSFGLSWGGTGLWNGSSLSVTAATNASPIVITTATPHGYTTGQTVSIVGGAGNVIMNGQWTITVTGPTTFSLTGSTGNGTYTGGATVYNAFPNDGYQGVFTYGMAQAASYTSGQTCINMIADKTFIIAHLREQDLFQSNARLAIHIEIPERLYPQGVDLHPVAVLAETIFTGSLYTTSSTLSYGGGFLMRTHSGDPTNIRAFRTLTKSLYADGTYPNSSGGSPSGQGTFGQSTSDYRIGYNTIAGTIPMAEGLLSQSGIANQYSFARARLRTVRFTGTHVPPHHRLGLNGEFIQLQNGICWPWDNTIMPQQLLLFGSG